MDINIRSTVHIYLDADDIEQAVREYAERTLKAKGVLNSGEYRHRVSVEGDHNYRVSAAISFDQEIADN